MVLGVALFVAVLLAPVPDAMSVAAWRVVAVGVLMATWWVTEAIPIPATSLLPLVLFPLLGISPIAATAAPYANPVIFLFMGGFLIAAAWQRTGMHLRMALSIVQVGGMRPRRLVGSVMIATAFISMWVNSTATTAMLLPVALSIVALADDDGPRAANLAPALLLGVAYSASIGGLGTLIGTPPNALLAGFMAETHHRTISFVDWMMIGVPLVLVVLPICWLLLTRVFFPLGNDEIAGGRAVVDRQLAALGRMTRAEWFTGVVTAVTALLWMTRPITNSVVPSLSDAGIAVGGALLLFMLPRGDGRRILDREAIDQLPWGILVLFGGGLALAAGIQETGLAVWLGGSLRVLDHWPLVATVAVMATLIVFMSEFASNTAIAAAFLPVTAALGVAMGLDPIVLAVPTALAASGGFMMPVATPPNAMVYATNRVPRGRMMRVGFVLDVVMIAVVTLVTLVLVPMVFG
ncbi:MAG: DASS family sodium-coupled anion symporter [Gemmatimonadaceae bacterium]